MSKKNKAVNNNDHREHREKQVCLHIDALGTDTCICTHTHKHHLNAHS